MKIPLINGLLLILCTSSFGQAAMEPDKELLILETQRLAAIVAHNHDFLINMYDDEFHGVIASGHAVDKIKMIEFLESGSPLVIQSVEDVRARIFGAVAVTTGKLVSKSKSGSIIGQSRFTHVYLKKNDHWKMIEGQGTVIIQE